MNVIAVRLSFVSYLILCPNVEWQAAVGLEGGNVGGVEGHLERTENDCGVLLGTRLGLRDCGLESRVVVSDLPPLTVAGAELKPCMTCPVDEPFQIETVWEEEAN